MRQEKARYAVAVAIHGGLVLLLALDAGTRTGPCLGDYQTRNDCTAWTAVPELALSGVLLLALARWWRSGGRVALLILDAAVLLVAGRYGSGDAMSVAIGIAALAAIGGVVYAGDRPNRTGSMAVRQEPDEELDVPPGT